LVEFAFPRIVTMALDPVATQPCPRPAFQQPALWYVSARTVAPRAHPEVRVRPRTERTSNLISRNGYSHQLKNVLNSSRHGNKTSVKIAPEPVTVDE
jgi:hypothetical protein